MAIELFTAEKILELAIGAIIETGAGKLTEGTIAKGRELWDKIYQKLRNERVAEAALVEVEHNQSQEHLAQVVPFLEVEMLKDSQFAEEIRTLAEEIKAGSQDKINIEVKNAKSSPVVGKQEGEGNKIVGTEIGTQINFQGKE